MTNEIRCLVTQTKTGEPTKRQMDAAKALTSAIIARVGKKVIAEKFGISVQRIYKWNLIPSAHLMLFYAAFCDELETPERLRPDMFTMKK